jgi:hypothetical protein
LDYFALDKRATSSMIARGAIEQDRCSNYTAQL